MSLLDLFAARSEARRDRNKRHSRFRLESLEGRQVLSTINPMLRPPLAAEVSLLKTGKASPAPVAPPSNPGVQSNTAVPDLQTGTTFGLGWKVSKSPTQGNLYYMNIQNVPGSGTVTLSRTKAGVFFTAQVLENGRPTLKTVFGPALPQDATVTIRNYRTAGDINIVKSTGLYWSLTNYDRVGTSYVPTPNGQSIQLTYTYNSLNNTGVLDVYNVRGTGRFVYSTQRINPRPGEAVDSPTANPIQSIDFVNQQKSDYVGSAGIYHTGEADPTITINIRNGNGGQFYQIDRGAW